MALPLGWRLRATVAALTLPPLLEVVSLSRLARRCENVRPRPVEGLDDDHAAEWVSRVLWRLPPPWRHTCLRRAVVLFCVLRRAGRPVELRIDVSRDDERAVTAHAWLVRDGEPYLESNLDHHKRFRLIASFPEPTRTD
jgi:hypothetical protein